MPRKNQQLRTLKADRKTRQTGKETSGTAYIKARRLALKTRRGEISVMLASWPCTDTKARKAAVSANADVMAARQKQHGTT